MDEIRENYFHQEEKEGFNDSKPKSCGEEADDTIEGMESDDTHRYQMFYLSLIYQSCVLHQSVLAPESTLIG